MFCPNCGQKIEGEEKFCTECGAPLEGASTVKKKGSSRWPKIIGIGGGAVIIIIVAVLLTGGIPGKTSLAGSYICEQDSAMCLNLNKDGTFFLGECGVEIGATGEWQANGSTLTLRVTSVAGWTLTEQIGQVMTGEINGGQIIIEGSLVFEKQ
jgi:predicted nucleic acid-binding Zn ribbon protein